MNDNPNTADIPIIAEAKEPYRPSQQMLAIKREIMAYAGGQAHFIERIDEQCRIIEEQKSTITAMQKEMETLRRNSDLSRLWEYEKSELYHSLSEMRQHRGRIQSDLTTAKKAIEWIEESLERMERNSTQTENNLISIRRRFFGWDTR